MITITITDILFLSSGFAVAVVSLLLLRRRAPRANRRMRADELEKFRQQSASQLSKLEGLQVDLRHELMSIISGYEDAAIIGTMRWLQSPLQKHEKDMVLSDRLIQALVCNNCARALVYRWEDASAALLDSTTE